MPYKYTCPLCLDLLTRGHSIKVFKIADASSGAKSKHLTKRFDCGRRDFIEEVLKFSGDDVFVPVEELAVYVSHDGCKAVNPFWAQSNNQIEMPGNYGDGDKFTADLRCNATTKNFQKVMDHWIVKILRETYELGNDYAPMWYPLQLLLATAAEEGSGLSRPYGSLVEMASTKSAGKTILTLQILNQALYRNGLELTVKEFFYPNPDSEDIDLARFKEKFYSEVFFHSMWRETPVSRPFGTEPSPGDLRAVFVQPVAADEQPDGGAVKQPSNGRVRGMARGIAGLAWFFVKETVSPSSTKKKNKKDKEPSPDLGEMIAARKDEFWNPIIFYDTAGE
ncbi:MAG TPA: hypothetical protein VD835_00940, partial [Pyrinomonadaceae bacterium]|nr:hypothetical protein [Pyrinomonadaceae bacterium]